MKTSLLKLFIIFSVLSFTLLSQEEVINIYGPGGPHTALIEAAKLYKMETGVTVNVIYGPQAKWWKEGMKKADIMFSASDNQITAFIEANNKNFSQMNVVPLYLHDSIILVKKGNPKKIKGIQSLIDMDNVRIVVNDGAGVSQTSGTGVWEDIIGRYYSIDAFTKFRKKIVAFVPNSGMGRAAFTDSKLQADAWITWSDWALSNDFGEAVKIENHLNIARPLNFALRNNYSQAVKDFTDWLTTEKVRVIFAKYGWYHHKMHK